ITVVPDYVTDPHLSAFSCSSHLRSTRHTSPMCSNPPGVPTPSRLASCSRYTRIISWISAHTLSLAFTGALSGIPDAIAEELQGSQYSSGFFPCGHECDVSWPNPSWSIMRTPLCDHLVRVTGILRCSGPVVRTDRRASVQRYRSALVCHPFVSTMRTALLCMWPKLYRRAQEPR